jgi:imidazolonepropionase
METLPGTPLELASEVYDVAGRCLAPGLLDCHTHVVYAGDRAQEFAMRLQGASYETIARAGGGILSTVKATRDASEDALFAQSAVRVDALLKSGVTTIEIKSGYGLDCETEIKMLRVAKKIERLFPVTVRKTFLAAHAVPPEFAGNAQAYVDLICDDMLPKVAAEKLADAVDVFCEKIAFDLAQTERIFKTASHYHLPVKCHAEQFSDSGSAALAAHYHALSADHLEHVSLAGIKALAQAGTVAVLLPGAFYFLRETKMPPIDLLREHHIPIAIASDCNPGTSPVLSLLFVLNMACTLLRLTPEEALLGVTRHAAKALGMESTHGTLAVGKAADLTIWNVTHPAELAYYVGNDPLYQRVKNGRVVR